MNKIIEWSLIIMIIVAWNFYLIHMMNKAEKEMKKDIKLQAATGDDGQLVSPGLPEGVKNYLIDIDGTVTDDVPNEEPERMKHVMPYKGAVETLSRWYDEGHVITFFTSRTEEVREITEQW